MLYYPDSSVEDLVFVQPEESIVAIIGDLVNTICEVCVKDRAPVGPVKDLVSEHCFNIITSKTEPNCSNYITLGNEDSIHVDTFEKLHWFEVYSESCDNNNNSAVRKAVDSAIIAIKRKLPKEVHAFKCECKEVPYDHVAVASNQSKCLVRCVVSNKSHKDDRYSLWFAG